MSAKKKEKGRKKMGGGCGAGYADGRKEKDGEYETEIARKGKKCGKKKKHI